ncbi:hypothetical protein COV19_06875 [Candidatus Woesearchaeota archaeon CG10_big_fil_rev_8_21_14_0_10_44_13]|nr:MAG: hypothetical protein COV19_06875 [Candidatus Woesearchaeota archaeon CG10_big_fil_rev_8_21_14_0_10_44_13]
MKTPTKILVLAALVLIVAMLATGCIRKVDESEGNYTEIENFSDLGVVDEGNQKPEAAPATTATETTPAGQQLAENEKITVKEGQLITLKATGEDPDGDKVTYTFSPPFDADGKWQTKVGDKGTYSIKVIASDGKSTTTKTFDVAVNEKNKAPVLEAIPRMTVVAGETVTLTPKAADPNSDELIITYSGWMNAPAYATTDNDIGLHEVTVTVSDGEFTDSETATIDVVSKNHAPVMEKIDDVVVNEGDSISFSPNVIDVDGDKVTVQYSGWMTGPTYTTGYDDAGQYTVKVTVSDGKLETSQDVKVTVKDNNRPVPLSIWVEIS